MKCRNCELNVEFPIYEEEVIIQTQPFFGPNVWSTKTTGRTIPVCPFCQFPIYGGSIIRDGWIKGPRKLAEEEHMKQVPLRGSTGSASK